MTFIFSSRSFQTFFAKRRFFLTQVPTHTYTHTDLTALLTLFFCSSSGSHDDRIQNALVAVFVPTVDSMLSTIFGCVALAFSDISLYVKFFFWMYFAVAVLGCLNGLLLLPVLLAWAGPSEFGGNPTATAKVSDVFSEPKGTADTKTKHPL